MASTITHKTQEEDIIGVEEEGEEEDTRKWDMKANEDECDEGEGCVCDEKQVSLVAMQLASYPVIEKMGGFEFYRKVLNSPKYIVAPMVDQSFLAFRALCRRYDAQLCYTPMLHSKVFAQDAVYRRKYFSTCPEDRPLVVQFCGNDPLILLKAAKLVEGRCDAVDINLGCPQNIARKGNYGAFLMKHTDRVYQLVRTLHLHLKVPVFCKMRIYTDIEATVKFAKMLQEAGCQLLTVHGRTKEQKGHQLGLADWSAIRRIKEELSIPVFANGNIQTFADVERCLLETKVDGVMSAETILQNPALFSGKIIDSCDISHEYMDICEKLYPTKFQYIRTHLLQILKAKLDVYSDLRDNFSRARTIPQARNVVEQVRQRVLSNAPQVMYDVEIREMRKDRKINRTEEMWDNSMFEEA